MNRKLITQTLNEWPSNLWLVIEFSIIAACLYVVCEMCLGTLKIYMIPEGYNGHGAWLVELSYRDTDSDGYIERDSLPGEQNPFAAYTAQDHYEIIRRFEDCKLVETVGAGINALPYNYNFWGTLLNSLDASTDTIAANQINQRWMSPKMVEIMNLQGYYGESPAELAKVIERGDYIVTANLVEYINLRLKNRGEDRRVEPSELVGRAICLDGDSSKVFRIGAVALPMKRNEYEFPYYASVIRPLTPWYYTQRRLNIMLRLRPGVKASEFRQFFKDNAATLFSLPNVYVNGITEVNELIDRRQLYDRQEVFNNIICMAFLGISIFLGILGTFWFRTSQRASEIAIRKVNGATSVQIMRRLFAEGFILLIASIPLTALIEWVLTNFDLLTFISQEGSRWAEILQANLLAYCLLAIMMSLGIWLPTRKAMKIQPAITLKDE